MPQKYEKPTVKEDGSLHRGGRRVTHPAYGVIGLTRTTCNPPMNLFGSHIRHGSFITLRIHTAEKDTNGDYEFIHAKKPLCEVMLSGTQLGDLLTSMNVGDGVPCTIRMRETDWDIPAIEEEETPISESRKSMDEQIKRVMERADKLTLETIALLKDKKTINKTDLAKIVDSLKMIRQEIYSNTPFIAKCFDEKIEKTVTHAKGEVDAFISQTIRSAGLEAIAGGYRVELPYKNEEKVIDLIPEETDANQD